MQFFINRLKNEVNKSKGFANLVENGMNEWPYLNDITGRPVSFFTQQINAIITY